MRPGEAVAGGGPEEELETVVDAARRAVRRRSLRGVAREIGMSATGLRGLLNGAEPYGKTRDRLWSWYVREEGIAAMPPDEALGIVLALVRTAPDERAGAALVLDAVEAAHGQGGAAVPPWVSALRARLSGAAGAPRGRRSAAP